MDRWRPDGRSPLPSSTVCCHPPVLRHSRRVRQVSQRPRHHHGLPRLSRAQGSGARRSGDPRDLRNVGLHPPDHGAARQGRLRGDRARPAVAPRRDAAVDRRRTQDLDATVAYVKRLKAARSDRIGVIGFCWGGGQSFRYATNNPSLGAFVVCYGPGPDALSIARIRAKGLGVYAENDARINAGLADVDAAIRTYHKSYRYTVYPGVGHGFLRAREKPEVADSAWKAVVGFFRESLEH